MSHQPCIFAVLFGDVAQLARALAWHARGRGFESHLLHKTPLIAELVGFLISATTIATKLGLTQGKKRIKTKSCGGCWIFLGLCV